MKIAIFYNPAPGTVGDYFRRAFVRLGHAVDHYSTSGADQCRGGYAFYLRIDHGDYASDLPRRLRPAAFYAVDAHLAHAWRSIRRQARRYDAVFCVQQEAAKRLARAHWVPLACDDECHRAEPGPARYPLAFIGHDGGVPRKFYLQELRERYPHSFIGKARHTEMASVYRHANIGFHYIECTSPLRDMVSMRVYEVMAAGRLLLTNALDPETFSQLGMRDREELAIYHTPRELLELIDFYLCHEAERERIAGAGQRCVLGRHTYLHRAQQMLHIVDKELEVR